MVHQYRHDAKRYVSGTGRAARWDPVPPWADCAPTPQFWFPRGRLRGEAADRVDHPRVGFCDITGQTNERSMLVARIPAGMACGNKVPTITFSSGAEPEIAASAFAAIANSLVFDWALRRMVTTTVNFFLLRDLPWPDLAPVGLSARHLANLADRLGSCRHGPDAAPLRPHTWEAAEARVEIELRVADAWGLDFGDLETILGDFPLLDRAHASLDGEARSTVTRDYLLVRAAERMEAPPMMTTIRTRRIEEARRLGAVPFVPTHLHVPDLVAATGAASS